MRIFSILSLLPLAATAFSGSAMAFDSDSVSINISATVPVTCSLRGAEVAQMNDGASVRIATACNVRNFVLAFDGVPNLKLLSADGVRNASSTASTGMDAVLVTSSRATGQIVDVQFDNSPSDLQDLNINIIAN